MLAISLWSVVRIFQLQLVFMMLNITTRDNYYYALVEIPTVSPPTPQFPGNLHFSFVGLKYLMIFKNSKTKTIKQYAVRTGNLILLL